MKKHLALLLVILMIFSVFTVVVIAGNGQGNGGNSSGGVNSSQNDNGQKNGGNNGVQEQQQLKEQDQIQEHIDDPFYQNLDLNLTEEEQAEFDQLKEDFFSDRDEINVELRDKRQTLNTLDADTDQEEIADLESQITLLEDDLAQLRDSHIEDIEELVGEEITETE
jgi:hypothetical protein